MTVRDLSFGLSRSLLWKQNLYLLVGIVWRDSVTSCGDVVIIRTVHTSLYTSHLRLKGSRPNASLSVLLDHWRKICPFLYVVFQGFMFYAVTADAAPEAAAALKPRYRSPYHRAVKPLFVVGLVPDFG